MASVSKKRSLGAPRGSVGQNKVSYKKLYLSNFFGKKFFLKLGNFSLPYSWLKLGHILFCGSKRSLTLVVQTMHSPLKKKKFFHLSSKFKTFLRRLFCFVSTSLMQVQNFHFFQNAKLGCCWGPHFLTLVFLWLFSEGKSSLFEIQPKSTKKKERGRW